MGKIVYATLIGLFGAALVHLVIVLLLPRLSDNDAWRQLQAKTPLYEAVRLDGDTDRFPAAQSLDPLFAVFACRYDLSDGVFSITAPGNAEFWSVAVFDDSGTIVFSANDRIAASDSLNLGVALPPQIRTLQQDPLPALDDAIVTPSQRREGFVVMRVFRPDRSWEPVVDRFIAETRCEPIPV